jgi:hypothetical protein
MRVAEAERKLREAQLVLHQAIGNCCMKKEVRSAIKAVIFAKQDLVDAKIEKVATRTKVLALYKAFDDTLCNAQRQLRIAWHFYVVIG